MLRRSVPASSRWVANECLLCRIRHSRHTFGTLLKANGEDVKTVQELLRHANSRITLDVYTQAVGSNKRAAQSKVVGMMIPGMGQNAGEMDPR
jgi:integrase